MIDRESQVSIGIAAGILALSAVAYLVLHGGPEAAALSGGQEPEPPPDIEVPESTPSILETPAVTVPPTSSPTPAESPTVREQLYAFPVQPPSAARYEPGHEAFPATDIYAPVGTDYVAVTSGVVDEVQRTDPWYPGNRDPNARQGLYVAIVGDDGVRYYGCHLSMVVRGLRRGDRVEVGQLLGRIGTTGKAKPGPPYVHFGISHPTFPGDWEVRRGTVDPYRHLREWESGRDSVPTIAG